MTPQNYSTLNSSQGVKNPFLTPASGGLGGLVQSGINSLTANTKPFSPSALATGNTIGAPWAQLPTPQMTNSLSLGPNGALPAGLTPMGGQAPIKTTPTGGIAFSPSTFSPSNNTAPVSQAGPQQNVSYNSYQTPNGGSLSLDGSGNVAGYTPATGYNINTSGALPSTALGSSTTMNDIMQQRNQYADAVAGLAQAQQYSPDFIAALQGQQAAQAQGAQIQSNFYTGNNLPGDTLAYAQGATARAQSQNSLSQLSATQALQVQTLLRQGNIAGAQALVDAFKPQSVSPGSSLVSPVSGQETYNGLGGYTGVQAIQTYNNLQQNFPDAQIPPYNQSLTPEQNLQAAQTAAAQSPSFQSRNLVPVQLPGGGYSFVNKNQLITGPNGQSQIISSADAAQADAYKTAIGTLTNQGAQISSQINTVDNNFPLLLNIVQKYNLNANLPLMNQFQQLGDKQLGQSGVVQLNAIATGLKATIAQIVSRGGSVDNQTRNEANALLPTTVNFSTLQDLYRVVKAEGAGVVKGINDEKQQNVQGLTNIYSTGATPGSGGGSSSGGGYINPAQATW